MDLSFIEGESVIMNELDISYNIEVVGDEEEIPGLNTDATEPEMSGTSGDTPSGPVTSTPGKLLTILKPVTVDKLVTNSLTIEPDMPGTSADSSSGPITSTPCKLFQCSTCDFETKYQSNLRRHSTIAHTHELQTCDTCNKRYRSKYLLAEHISIHHMANTFLCELCSKKFNSRSARIPYKKFIHEDSAKFECNYCRKKFYEKSLYFGHLNEHSGNKPYNCKMCSKSYPYQTSLVKHEISCTGDKPAKYACKMCDARLKSSASLKDHIDGKHGTNTKMCRCGKVFKWRSCFARHVKKCRLNAKP